MRYRPTVCRNNLLLRGPVLSLEEASALDDACKTRNKLLHATGRRRHHVDAPFFYLKGLLLPILLPQALQVLITHWASVTAIPDPVSLVFFFDEFVFAVSFLLAWP